MTLSSILRSQKTWRRTLQWAVAAAAYGGLLLVTLGLSSYFAFTKFVRRGALRTPDVRSLALVEAEERLVRVGLRPRHSADEDRFDEAMVAGLVLQQAPAAGSLVKQGGRVDLVLSRGRQLVSMPDLLGRELQVAQTELAAAGLAVGRRNHVYWPGGRAGMVVHQSRAPGTSVDQASTVDLLIALGDPEDTYVMPDLTYRSAESVRGFFERRGFRLGSVKYEPYEGVEEGVVLRHTPLAGHPLRRQDVITLVVATRVDSLESR